VYPDVGAGDEEDLSIGRGVTGRNRGRGMQIAIGQFASGEDTAANLARVGDLVKQAASAGARLLVLPEYSMFSVPTMDDRFVATAEPLDGRFVTELGHLAATHDLHIVVGMNEAIPGEDRIYNTVVALTPDRSIAATYRKTHLYDAFGYRESDRVQAGPLATPDTFRIDGLTFGMQTCYDLRFPEVTRTIVDAGADVLLLPAAWMPGPLKEDHWTTLVRARAIENTLYVAAADQNAPVGSGASMIVDPMGVVLAGLGERDGIAVADVDSARLAAVRARNPSVALRRYAVVPR